MGRLWNRLARGSRASDSRVGGWLRGLVLPLLVQTASSVAGAEPTPPPPPESILAAVAFLPGRSPGNVTVDLAPEGARSFPLTLDTGSDVSVVTPALARAMGVTVRRTKSSPYRRPTRLGRDLQFWVDTSYGDSRSFSGWQYGLLGEDFLSHFVVEIDYPARFVRFLDPDKYQVPESVDASDEKALPFKWSGTRILVDFELEGRTHRAMLDTGGELAALLAGSLVEKAGIDVDSLPEGIELQSTMGTMKTRLLETETFRFGGFPFERMGLLVAPRGFYNIGGPTDSVIGYDVLRQFTLRIDYARRRIWLRRDADTTPTFNGVPYERARREVFGLELSEEEIEKGRADAERHDEAWEAAWKKRQASRMFVEEAGGWQVVEGWRLRRGPKPGEVWLTYEEMMEVEKSRAGAERSAGPEAP